ncbi:MAG: FTR1 family protein [Alphaproteobacteria bacterium]|nr:FTR1 family protein [Alphaproteobacteria bacterium]MCB9930346.1 FTR1 family protein [Alphaproteobacteria bacterium]
MGAALVIVFREVLEAALVVGIVLAATEGVPGRLTRILAGVAAGVAGAVAVAFSAGTIASAVAGMGQEVFNATVLFAAVAMLAWHNIWMSRHAGAEARHVAALGEAVAAGGRPLKALTLLVALAVLREGSEVVLFLYGIAAGAGAEGMWPILSGGALGVVAGAAAGVALYLGLVRIPTRHLFKVTSWMILLVAAGMAAQGAGFLVQAGFLPALVPSVWDTSAILSERGMVGQLLHTLVGYIARPDGMQVLFYAGTILILGGAMRLTARKSGPPGTTAALAAVSEP